MAPALVSEELLENDVWGGEDAVDQAAVESDEEEDVVEEGASPTAVRQGVRTICSASSLSILMLEGSKPMVIPGKRRR